MADLAMSWAEWSRHDGVALAELVRCRQVSAQQIAAQAAAAVDRLNPKLEAVIEVFDDSRGQSRHGRPGQGGPAVRRADLPEGSGLRIAGTQTGLRVGVYRGHP